MIGEVDRDKYQAPVRTELVDGLRDKHQRGVLSGDGARQGSRLTLRNAGDLQNGDLTWNKAARAVAAPRWGMRKARSDAKDQDRS